MFEQYANVVKKYAVFSGRASRKEFWMFMLVHYMIHYLLFFAFGTVAIFYALALMVPMLAVFYRRIQDTGHSGHWTLLMFTGIGLIAVLILVAMPGTPGPNEYGPSPYGYGGRSAPARPPAPQMPKEYDNTAPYVRPQSRPTAEGQVQIIGQGGAMGGRVYLMDAEKIVFGRDNSARVRYVNNEGGISRIHCTVFMKGSGLYLMDCGSTYGTYLARMGKLTPQRPVALKSGDTFYLGSKKNGFTIRLTDS